MNDDRFEFEKLSRPSVWLNLVGRGSKWRAGVGYLPPTSASALKTGKTGVLGADGEPEISPQGRKLTDEEKAKIAKTDAEMIAKEKAERAAKRGGESKDTDPDFEKEISTYKTKVVLGNTGTQKALNESRVKQFGSTSEDIEKLKRKRQRIEDSKRKNKVSEIEKVDRDIKKEEHRLFSLAKSINIPNQLISTKSKPVGDRVVRVLSGGKVGNALEGKMHIPYSVSTQGEKGYLSPRISITGGRATVDFTREGVNVGGSNYQGTSKQRMEVERYVQDYLKDIKLLLE